jgi:DNA ligase D-like protein (predicted ligase)
LQSRELNAEYRRHNTKENQWLLERVDVPQADWLGSPVEPMLARPALELPRSQDYFFELKWDGIRALFSLDEGQLKIRTRNGMDITTQFPELASADQAFRAASGLFDGEIVCLEPDGKPNFENVIHRLQQKSESAIKLAGRRCPAVCYLFDCLYLDGRAIVNEPLERRREWLQDAIKSGTSYCLSEVVQDGPAFYEAVKQLNLEGIMAKQRQSVYVPGKRSDSWLKVKTRQTVECVIIGFVRGKGDRASTFGSLHLAEQSGGALKYIGKAGSGFDEKSLKDVSAALDRLPRIKRPVKEKPLDDSQSVWVEPLLMCEIQFASRTKTGSLREPVFLRMRPDLTFKQ